MASVARNAMVTTAKTADARMFFTTFPLGSLVIAPARTMHVFAQPDHVERKLHGFRMSALVEAEGLVKHFVARRSVFGRALATVKAVDGVSFTVDAGKTLALVGESGSGKSTVGRLVLRLIEPTAGRVRFAGKDVFTLSEAETRAYRRQAQLVFQDPYASLNPRMTVADIIGEPIALHGIVPPTQRRQRVAEVLEMV